MYVKMHDIYVLISFRMTIENNADRNVVCRKESLDSIQSDLRKRFDSESSVEEHEFDHLEPLDPFEDLNRYCEITERSVRNNFLWLNLIDS